MDVISSIFLLLLLGTSSANIFKKVTSPCKSTNVKCLSENTFTYCLNNGEHSALMYFVFNCPENYICDDDTKFPCVKSTNTETSSIEGIILSNEVDPVTEGNVLIEPESKAGSVIIVIPTTTTTTTTTTPKINLITSPQLTTESEITSTDAIETPNPTDDTSSESTEATESATTQEITTTSMPIESEISSSVLTQETVSSTITDLDTLPEIIQLLFASLSDASSGITAPSKISFSNSFVTSSEILSENATNITKPTTDTTLPLIQETPLGNENSTLITDHAPTAITHNISSLNTATSPITFTTSAFTNSHTTPPSTILSHIKTDATVSIPSAIIKSSENLSAIEETASLETGSSLKKYMTAPVTLLRTSYTKNCTSNTTSITKTHSPNTIAAPLTPSNYQTVDLTINSSNTTPITIKSFSPLLNTNALTVKIVGTTTTTPPPFRTIPSAAPNIEASLNINESVTTFPDYIKSRRPSRRPPAPTETTLIATTLITKTTPRIASSSTHVTVTRPTVTVTETTPTETTSIQPTLNTRTTPSITTSSTPVTVTIPTVVSSTIVTSDISTSTPFVPTTATSTETTLLGRVAPAVFEQIRHPTAKISKRPTRKPPVRKTQTVPKVRIHKRPLNILNAATSYKTKFGLVTVTKTSPTQTTSIRPTPITRTTPSVTTSSTSVTVTKPILITKTTPSATGTTTSIAPTLIIRTTPGIPSSSTSVTGTGPTLITKTTPSATTITTTVPWTIITNPKPITTTTTTTTLSPTISQITPSTTTTTTTTLSPTISQITPSTTTTTSPRMYTLITPSTTPQVIPTTTPASVLVTRTTPSTIITTSTTAPSITAIGPPNCTSTGFYPGPSCSEYYECVTVWWWFEYRLRTCTTGQYYSVSQKQCVAAAQSDCTD